jgi:Lon protease-like protein
MDDPMASQGFGTVRLFPLPNVVLLPGAVLPLHIFEERYKAMTADALVGDRQVAMALLRDGWEKSYYSRPPIEPVVCVGTILSHERLPDGNYNFLLQGHTRAQILGEINGQELYRIAKVKTLVETPAPEIDLELHRQKLTELFETGAYAMTGPAEPVRKLLAGPHPTPVVADLIAFNYFEDAAVKQAILAAPNVRARVERVIAELEELRPVPVQRRRSISPPSLN